MASTSLLMQHSAIPAAATLYNTFTTAKSMLGSSTATSASVGVVPLLAGFWQIGGNYTLDVCGAMSWASGNTMTLHVVVGGVQAFSSGAIKVTTTGGTTEPFWYRAFLTCRAVGSGTLANLIGFGTIHGRGICPIGATAGANYTAGMGYAMLQEAAPAVGTGFDSSVATTFDFHCAMGTSSASNGMRVDSLSLISRGNTAV